MEQRRNWRKFQEMAGFLPAKKSVTLVVSNEKNVLAGVVGASLDFPRGKIFQDIGKNIDHVDGTAEYLSHKYGTSSVCFLQREELLQQLGQISQAKGGHSGREMYYDQIMQLREAMHVQKGEKNKLAVHWGDKPTENFWPREFFCLELFDTMFSELLPEKKILLLGIVEEDGSLESLALEFLGTKLQAYSCPDWSNLDWQGAKPDYFHRPTLERFILWCENHYMLPTYAFFMTRRMWVELREIQTKDGSKAAWRHFQKSKGLRDVEPEAIMEPEPWPIKAALQWHSLRE